MTQAETALAHPGEIWILSAQRCALGAAENERRADTLASLAAGLLSGATLLPAFGVWEGSRERSLVILVPASHRGEFKARVGTFVLSAAEAYQQEAVIYRPKAGVAAILYHRDPSGALDEFLGVGRILAPVETAQGWTEFQDGSRLTF